MHHRKRRRSQSVRRALNFHCRGTRRGGLRPKHLGVKCKTQLRPIPVNHSHPALPRNLLGSSNMSAADANKEMPATASPPYKPIQPVAYGPANPPRFASELTKAIPEAAANPVRKSPGSE